MPITNSGQVDMGSMHGIPDLQNKFDIDKYLETGSSESSEDEEEEKKRDYKKSLGALMRK